MKLSLAPHRLLCRLRKPLVCMLAAGGLALAGTTIFILLLPVIISSSFGQRQLHSRLEAALGRTVAWEQLELSWRRGLRLAGLRLGDGPAPLRRLQMETLTISFGVARSEVRPLLVSFSLQLSGLTAEVEPAPEETPEVNPEEMLAELAGMLQETLRLEWRLPVDVQIDIDIGQVAVRSRETGSGEAATVEDLHFTLRASSLLTAPIQAAAAANLKVDGQPPLPPLTFSLAISELPAGGRLRPAGARIDLQTDFPGLHANLHGTLAGSGLTGGVQLQPAILLPVIQPFLAAPLPQVTGLLAATLESEIVADGDLRLQLALQGEALAASGGPLGQQKAGPLSFTLSQQVVTDHRRDTVAFPEGELLVPEIMEARWQAAVEHPLSPRRQVTASFGPVIIRLPALLAQAQPFLPADLPLASVAGRLECDSLAVALGSGGLRGEVTLHGLRLLLDRLALRPPAGDVITRDLRLEVAEASIPIVGGFPGSARLRTGLQLGGLRMQGEQPLILSGLTSQVEITIEDLQPQPASRFGVAARLAVEQDLSLASLRLPGTIEIAGVQEKLRAGIHVDAQGGLHIELQAFSVLAQGSPTAAAQALPALALDLQARGAKVRLPATDTLPQVHDLQLRLQLEPGLRLTARADVTPEQGGAVKSEGQLTVDLAPLVTWAKALLPPGVGGEGEIDVAWHLLARAPTAGLPEPAVVNPLQQARAFLALLTAADLTVNIKNGGVRLGDLNPVTAGGINTPVPLRLVVREGAQLASLELVGTVERLSGLADDAGLPPQMVRLALQGEEQKLTTASFTGDLRVEPAGLTQVVEVVVEKLDRLAELPGVPAPADLLRHLNGSLFATLDLRLPEQITVPAPLQLGGDLAAGLRVDLEGGKQLRVGAFGDLRDFDFRLPDGPEVEGLNLRLALNRLFQIGDRQQALPPVAWLSEKVLARDAGAPALPAPLVAERLWQDLRGVSGRERSLAFGRARARVAGLPLELSAGEGALQLDGLQPGINYLQMGLLGGSLKARAGLDLGATVPRAELLCAFSNLDISRLLPESVKREKAGAAELTGELALQLPLFDDSRQLLEKLDLRLHLWRIGARTLEQALFALDPHEQNEAIIEQRKMLRLGSLRRLQVTAGDGSLSTAGEIEVGGTGIELPRINRLNLASLPLEAMLSESLQSLPPLLSLLDLAAANYLEIGADGVITPRRVSTGESP